MANLISAIFGIIVEILDGLINIFFSLLEGVVGKEQGAEYTAEFASQLQGEASARWKNEFITFRTVMEIVN